MDRRRGMNVINNAGFLLTVAESICAGTIPDIAAAYVKLKSGGK